MKSRFTKYYPVKSSHDNAVTAEDSFYEAMLLYSMRHIALIGKVNPKHAQEALQKALRICQLAGMNSKHHFKQIFLFDAPMKTFSTDWMMSRTGFNLMVIQIPSMNEKKALWLWKLAESRSFL